MNKNSYELIDVLKLFFAVCVVGIHTNLLCDFNNDLQWYIYAVFFLLAVPFFFIVTGFLFGSRLQHNNIDDITHKTIKRLLVPLLFYLIISIPYKFISVYHTTGGISLTIVELVKGALFYPWSSLWFLHASIIAIFILRFFIKHDKLKFLLIINVISYAICLLPDSYQFLISSGSIRTIIKLYLNIFISTRNGIFAALPFITAGYYIALKKNKLESFSLKKCLLLFLLFFIFLIFEVTKIRYLSTHYSFFIFSIPVAAYLLIICIKLKNIRFKFDTIMLRNLSTSIYFMHGTIIGYISLINPNLGNNTMFLLVFVVMFIIIIPLYKINNRVINLVLK